MQVAKTVYSVARFPKARILFSANDAAYVEETYAHFSNGLEVAAAYFGPGELLPFFTVYLAPEREEYDFLVSHLTTVPTGKGRLGQPQGSELYLLSPGAYSRDALAVYLGPDGKYDKVFYHDVIAHEVVHMMEEYFSPCGAMAVLPKWWQEGLAVYLSGQYEKDVSLRKYMLADFSKGGVPAIGDLRGGSSYVWGWSIVQFIEKRFGKEKIREIVRNSMTIDVEKSLGMEPARFEQEWRDFAAGYLNGEPGRARP